MQAAMKAMEKEHVDIEVAKVKREIVAQVKKDAEEQAMVQTAADRKAEVDAEATAIKAKEAAAETKAAV